MAASKAATRKNVMDIGTITMELTQGYALKDGKVGIQDIRNWQDPDFLGFVSSITSSTGARQLREVSHPGVVGLRSPSGDCR